MDPLSDVLSLLNHIVIGRGLAWGGDFAGKSPKHAGIKCYAVVWQCWLSGRRASDDWGLFLLPHALTSALPLI
jgi:hypothetical protein